MDLNFEFGEFRIPPAKILRFAKRTDKVVALAEEKAWECRARLIQDGSPVGRDALWIGIQRDTQRIAAGVGRVKDRAGSGGGVRGGRDGAAYTPGDASADDALYASWNSN